MTEHSLNNTSLSLPLAHRRFVQIDTPPVTSMPITATCLYCKETKPQDLFNREHVLPQSFGTFDNNMVLRNLVCEDCNTYFSRTLELRLGRESFEGVDR